MNVSVVGLGKLGLPLLALLANSGHKVIGFDKSISLIESLKNGESPYPEPGLSELLKSGVSNIEYVSSIAEVVEKSEVCFVIVPTPSTDQGGFDNGAVLAVCKEIGASLKNNPKEFTVDIVSTVMPGSCDGEIRKSLEKSSGFSLGEKLGLCYNPEFIALGSVIRDMQYPDMQLLGVNSEKHAEKVESVLHSITRKETPIRRMSLIEAELVKISVNNFVTMKIAFANMLGEIADRIGNMDIDVITDAIGLDSRIGKKYLKAGTPFGGPCFPRDTKALTALLGEHGIENSLPGIVDKANASFQSYLKNSVAEKSKGKKIGILGLSYKPDTPVIEESPGVKLLKDLTDHGLEVFGWDPLVKRGAFGLENLDVIDSIEEFTNRVEVLVITRPVPEVNKEHLDNLINKSEVIDFWRQIK